MSTHVRSSINISLNTRSTILQVCSTTVAIPGDGVDNDCDGMIDEEECTEQDLSKLLHRSR